MGEGPKIRGLSGPDPHFAGPVSYPFTQAKLRFKVRVFE